MEEKYNKVLESYQREKKTKPWLCLKTYKFLHGIPDDYSPPSREYLKILEEEIYGRYQVENEKFTPTSEEYKKFWKKLYRFHAYDFTPSNDEREGKTITDFPLRGYLYTTNKKPKH